MKTICYFDQENLTREIFKELFKSDDYNFFESDDLKDFFMCIDLNPVIILVDLKFDVDKISEFVDNMSQGVDLKKSPIVGVGFEYDIKNVKESVKDISNYIEKPIEHKNLIKKVQEIAKL